MDRFSSLVDIAVSIVNIVVALFLVYGAYLAIYSRQIWPKSNEPHGTSAPDKTPAQGSIALRGHERRLHVRRETDRRAVRVENRAGEAASASR